MKKDNDPVTQGELRLFKQHLNERLMELKKRDNDVIIEELETQVKELQTVISSAKNAVMRHFPPDGNLSDEIHKLHTKIDNYKKLIDHFIDNANYIDRH